MDIVRIISTVIYILIVLFILRQILPVKGLKNLSSDDLKEKIKKDKNLVLIDVRKPAEYSQGHIQNAINIPLPQLRRRVKEIPRDKEILIYCRNGMRSRQAGRILKGKGFSNIAQLRGGLLWWEGKMEKTL
ncbi:rhodanese-like domain-containing protein [Metabacillus fastidiosus]|uniref:rhodanese-like domain-containing protein n=1 Tax=Metabacillus fastidiosus TaxID=1458 RepID=UPI003D2DA4C0